MRMIFGAIGGMKISRGNRSTRRKPTPAPHFPPQNPTWQTRSRSPDRSGGKLATNLLSYGAAFFLVQFRRLLRLAGSRWRYSTPPPHGFFNPFANYPSGRDVFLTKSDAKEDILLFHSSCGVFWVYSDTKFSKFMQCVPFKRNPCVKKQRLFHESPIINY
jgi:hypothetical protein